MNKLIAQLKRELKRSPAKAAALGGGLFLAIWFWLPLLSEWFGGEGQSNRTTTAATAAAPATTAAATAPVASSEEQIPIDWRSMEAWRKASGYAQSYLWHEGMRNPFVPLEGEPTPELKVAEEEQAQLKQEVVKDLLKQQQLAELATLKLTSTLIMPGQRSATINGKVYREGEQVALAAMKEEAAAENSFLAENTAEQRPAAVAVIRRIESQNVVLEYGEQLYPLPLNRPTNSSIRMELR